MRVLIIFLCLLLSQTPKIFAQQTEKAKPAKKIKFAKQPEDTEQEDGPRAKHWSGFDIGAGIPFPSYGGFLIGFNLQDIARFSGGYGTTGDWGVYELDAKVFFSKTPATGYIGLGLDYLNGNEKKLVAWQLDFSTGLIPFIQAGIDYQSELGVHIGFGLGAAIPSGKTVIMPGLAIGWYF